MSEPQRTQLSELLDRYAPFRSPALLPEISVFYGRSLVEVWEAAERQAGSGSGPIAPVCSQTISHLP